MPVDTESAVYKLHKPEWVIMRDVIEGERAVKAKGTAYVPKLSEQSEDEYKAYLSRGLFFNATARVCESLVGMVFRRDPVLEAPTPLAALTEDITLTGVTLNDFAQNVLEEALDVSHGGIMVDHSIVDLSGPQKTAVQAEKENLRPYMRLYKAESIKSWKTRTVNGKVELCQVVLCEMVSTPTADEFEEEVQEQYRVLDLEPTSGNYRQRIFTGAKGTSGATIFTPGPDIFPLMNAKPMRSIAFFMFGNPNSLEKVSSPVLMDLALANLSHFRNSVDYEHGLHLTGLPTPWVAGVSDTDSSFRIGSGTAWVFGDAAARAGFLEFTGQGLDAMRQAMQDKQSLMAALGARILAPDKKAAEAADTVGMRREGETSVLATMAKHIARQITLAMTLMGEWMGASGVTTFTLNTDFNVNRLDSATIKSLLESVVAGQISSETFYTTMVDGEAIKSTRTYQEEREQIEAEGFVPEAPAEAPTVA